MFVAEMSYIPRDLFPSGLGPSINGLVTDGNTKLCCRGFVLAPGPRSGFALAPGPRSGFTPDSFFHQYNDNCSSLKHNAK